MFGGLCYRSGLLFVSRGGGLGRVTIVDAEQRRLRRNLVLLNERRRPVLAGGVAVSDTFSIYVADPIARVVRTLSLFGKPNGTVGTPAPRALPVAPDRRGMLAEPCAVAVDASGALYVASSGGPRVYAVQKYARTGRYLGSFRSFGVAGETFCSPRGIAVKDENVFVADTGNGAVQVFARNGSFRFAFSTAMRAGERSYPLSIACEPEGTLLLLDAGDPRALRRFTAGGELIATLVGRSDIEGPVAAAAGENGSVYLLDHDGDRLRVFDRRGRLAGDLIAAMEAAEPIGVPPGAAYGHPL